jgi:hypothetical protein
LADDQLRVMDHHYLEDHGLADRYLLGRLTAEERMRFEEHFVDCQECLERLETTESLRGALQTVAAEDAARASAYAKAGLLAWVARLGRGRRAALLASAVMLLLALPAVLLIREKAAGHEELAQAKRAAADWQRQYEERQQTARRLEKELEETKQQLAEQHAQFEARLEGERQARTRLADELSRSAQAQTSAPVFSLSTVRSGSEGQSRPVNQIVLSGSPQWVVLSLELEPDPDLQSYRATLLTTENQHIWSASNLQPNSREGLALSLNSKLFKPGTYLLTLEGVTSQGRYVPVAKYPFRAIKK